MVRVLQEMRMKPPCGQSRCSLRVWPEAPPGGQWTTGFKEEGLSSCSKAGVRWWHPALEGVNVLSRSSFKGVDWGGASAGSFFDVSESLGGIDTFNIFSLLTVLHLHIQKNAFPFMSFCVCVCISWADIQQEFCRAGN